MTSIKSFLIFSLLVIVLVGNTNRIEGQQVLRPVINGSNIGQVGLIDWLSRGYIDTILWSPDGKSFAIAAESGVWLYDAGNFELPPLEVAAYPANIAFSPDSSLLALTQSQTMTIWDIRTRKVKREFSDFSIPSDYYLPRPKFSPDGTTILVYNPFFPKLWVWDLATGNQIAMFAVLNDYRDQPSGPAFSPDSHTLAFIQMDVGLALWDIPTRKMRAVPAIFKDSESIALSPDGQWMATCMRYSDFSSNGVCFVLNAKTFDTTYILGNQDLATPSFSPDNNLLILTGASFHELHIWNMQERKWIELPQEYKASQLVLRSDAKYGVLYPAFSVEDVGTDLFAGVDLKDNQFPVVWDLARNQLIRTIDSGYGPAFNPDGQKLAFVDIQDRSIYIQETVSWKLLINLQGFSDAVRSIAFSADGTRIATGGGFGPSDGGSSYGVVRIWNVSTNERQAFMRGYRPGRAQNYARGHTDNVGAVAFSPDGLTLASLSYPFGDGSVRLWDVVSGTTKARLYDEQGALPSYSSQLHFSPDGKKLAFGTTVNAVQIWDALTIKKLVGLGIYRACDAVYCTTGALAFSRDSRTLTVVSSDKTVRQWDVATGHQLRKLDAIGSDYCSAFNQDGTLLATPGTNGYDAEIWNVGTNTKIGTVVALDGHPICPRALNIDGTVLAATDDAYLVLRLWSVTTGKFNEIQAAKPVTGQRYWAVQAVFSPDSTLLASADDDGTVKLWAVQPDF